MAHIYKASEWLSGSGRWFVADVEELAKSSSSWTIPHKIFQLSLMDYLEMLQKIYKVDDLRFSGNMLHFSWNENNYKNAHQYMLDINKLARKQKFIICEDKSV